jgi:hypothetical protein
MKYNNRKFTSNLLQYFTRYGLQKYFQRRHVWLDFYSHILNTHLKIVKRPLQSIFCGRVQNVITILIFLINKFEKYYHIILRRWFLSLLCLKASSTLVSLLATYYQKKSSNCRNIKTFGRFEVSVKMQNRCVYPISPF